jgi:hypothetical protein
MTRISAPLGYDELKGYGTREIPAIQFSVRRGQRGSVRRGQRGPRGHIWVRRARAPAVCVYPVNGSCHEPAGATHPPCSSCSCTGGIRGCGAPPAARVTRKLHACCTGSCTLPLVSTGRIRRNGLPVFVDGEERLVRLRGLDAVAHHDGIEQDEQGEEPVLASDCDVIAVYRGGSDARFTFATLLSLAISRASLSNGRFHRRSDRIDRRIRSCR